MSSITVAGPNDPQPPFRLTPHVCRQLRRIPPWDRDNVKNDIRSELFMEFGDPPYGDADIKRICNRVVKRCTRKADHVHSMASLQDLEQVNFEPACQPQHVLESDQWMDGEQFLKGLNDVEFKILEMTHEGVPNSQIMDSLGLGRSTFYKLKKKLLQQLACLLSK